MTLLLSDELVKQDHKSQSRYYLQHIGSFPVFPEIRYSQLWIVIHTDCKLIVDMRGVVFLLQDTIPY